MATPFVDPGLCIRFRYSQAQCRECADACPREAIDVGRGISINTAGCTNCGLCSPACPNEAITGAAFDLATAVPVLRTKSEPVLGCSQNLASSGDERIRCFGGLDTKDLAVLAVQVGKRVDLNMAPCHSCRAGGDVLSVVKRRIAELETHYGLVGDVSVAVRETFPGKQADSRGETRRGVLRLLGGFAKRTPPPAQRDLTTRRGRLTSTATMVLDPPSGLLLDGAGHAPNLSDECDHCCRCVGICPTPALERTRQEGRRQLRINAEACTGCGGCVDFCPPKAISITTHSLTLAGEHIENAPEPSVHSA